MKLELKHLAPYLPYQLKVINIEMHENGFRTKHSIKKLVLTPSNLEIGLKDIDGIKEKPILRPISDFNKEITISGNTFIPAVMLGFTSNLKKFDLQNFSENIHQVSFVHFMIFIEYHFDVFGLIDKGLAVSIHDVG